MLLFLFSIGTTLIMADEADDDKTTSSETVTEQIESDATQETSDEMQETTETEEVTEDVNQTKESEKRDEQFETEEPENSNTEKPSKVINMKRTSSVFDNPIFKKRTLKSDTSYHLLFVGEEKVFLTDSEQVEFMKRLKELLEEQKISNSDEKVITIDEIGDLLLGIIAKENVNKIAQFVAQNTSVGTEVDTKYFNWENWQDEVDLTVDDISIETKTLFESREIKLNWVEVDDKGNRIKEENGTLKKPDTLWSYFNKIIVDANSIDTQNIPVPVFYIESVSYYHLNYGAFVATTNNQGRDPTGIRIESNTNSVNWHTHYIHKHDFTEDGKNVALGGHVADNTNGVIKVQVNPAGTPKQIAANMKEENGKTKAIREIRIRFTGNDKDEGLNQLIEKYQDKVNEQINSGQKNPYSTQITEEDATKVYNNEVSVPLPLTSYQIGIKGIKLVKAVHIDEEGNEIADKDIEGKNKITYENEISISKKDIENYRFKSYDVYQDGELISQDNTNDTWTSDFIPDKKTGLVFHYQRVYKVDFESNGGTQVESQVVEKNGKVQEPEEPTRYNQMFGGWYKDKELTEKYNFENETVKDDITLYAKWVTPIVDPQDGVTPIKPIDKISDIDQDNSLLIKYVSEFDFGTHENTVLKGIEGKAKADKIKYLDGDKKNEIVDSPLFVSIVDNREKSSRAWELQVKATPFKTASNTILENAKIQLTGLKYADTEKAMPEISQDGSITLSEESQTISSTKGNIEGETWSLSLGGLDNTEDAEANSTGVSIVIPKGSIKKNEQYNATIEWELTPPI